MRKRVFIFLLTLICGVSFHAKAQISQKITVLVNEKKTIAKNKLTIQFVSLVEDSRCPTDTKCVWAGNAKIKIKISKANGAAKTFELNTNLKPRAIFYAGYEIKLTELNPKPATNIRINRNGYRAAFFIRKL